MKHLLILILLLPNFICAQLVENFEDGDLTNNVHWSGDTMDFKVNNNQQLQLNSSGESLSFVSSGINSTDLCQWDFWVKMACSPSDNNQIKIYLASDSSDPTECSKAYYVKLGETGTSDAIELYYQDETGHTLIAKGKEGSINAAFEIRIQIIRDDGFWQISLDKTGGINYQEECTGVNEDWQSLNWFAIMCKYTSSNATKFYFDDIYAGQRNSDKTPPRVKGLYVNSPSSLELEFNESIQPGSLLQNSNYSVDSDFGQPVLCKPDSLNPAIVHMDFPDSFTESVLYNLQIKNLKDMAGNLMHDTIVTFQFNRLRQFDVIINEIMADPSPPVGLPECEYIELYNRTDHQIAIRNWELRFASVKKHLPDILLAPKAFHLVTATGCDSLLSPLYGPCSALPGFTLLNTGAVVGLYGPTDELIHAVSYEETWYQNPKKSNGGWALEQVDVNNPCGGVNNWKVSCNQSGGTPGSKNSVIAENADVYSPEVMYATVKNDSSVLIVFNEQIDTLTLKNNTSYFCDHNIGNPKSIKLHAPGYYSADLIFKKHFVPDSIYTINIANKLLDCAGNCMINYQTVQFGIARSASKNDLVINELLFNTYFSGQEFVEIYNRSKKVIDLSDIWISSRDHVTGNFTNNCAFPTERKAILPGDYLVVARDPEMVKQQYYTQNAKAFIKLSCLPQFSNSEGNITIISTSDSIIDEFNYSEEMQFPLLESNRGVSLERINPDTETNKPSNWHSASQSAGYATPGYRNSQYLAYNNASAQIEVIPDAFSPDNDGYNDVTTINCTYSKPGFLTTIIVFDSFGRQVKLITANHLSGEKDHFNWDGTDNNNSIVSRGIYIVYTEIVNPLGERHSYKNTIVVSGF